MVKYIGTTKKVEAFGRMVYRHALDNGLRDADAVVFIGDGARWIRSIQEEHFPAAVSIIDQFHAIEHVEAMVAHLQFAGRSSTERKKKLVDECVALLRQGKIELMLEKIEAETPLAGHEKKLTSAMDYYRNNASRMDYGVLKAAGLFVGSGVVEAGCKVIVGNRMKQAGQHWKKRYAEKMIALRCAIRNGEYSKLLRAAYKNTMGERVCA
jgi:hypothetical protein